MPKVNKNIQFLVFKYGHVQQNTKYSSFVKKNMTFGLVCWWGNLSVKNREKKTEYTPFLAKLLCAVHPIPVWSNCISQEHCKWQPNPYLTPLTSYTTVTNFSPLEGGTECQQ